MDDPGDREFQAFAGRGYRLRDGDECSQPTVDEPKSPPQLTPASPAAGAAGSSTSTPLESGLREEVEKIQQAEFKARMQAVVDVVTSWDLQGAPSELQQYIEPFQLDCVIAMTKPLLSEYVVAWFEDRFATLRDNFQRMQAVFQAEEKESEKALAIMVDDDAADTQQAGPGDDEMAYGRVMAMSLDGTPRIVRHHTADLDSFLETQLGVSQPQGEEGGEEETEAEEKESEVDDGEQSADADDEAPLVLARPAGGTRARPKRKAKPKPQAKPRQKRTRIVEKQKPKKKATAA